jgi:2-phosphosulfolactate phosphatase
MPGVVRTYLLPQLAEASALSGGIAIVIDQLRASSTICAAIASGALGVIPCMTEDDARAAKAARPPGTCLTGGERDGVLIPGFDLDNSPSAYTPDAVRSKTIAFTTTNGTKAAVLAEGSDLLVAGCLSNLTAVVSFVGVDDRPVHILCAGTRQRVTLEDILAAGAIAERLQSAGRPIHLPDSRPDDDSSLLAIRLWRDALARPGGILESLHLSRGGRNLKREHLEADVEACSRIDATPVVPLFDRAKGMFVRAQIER